jgi:hypothetical protein
MIKDDPEKDHWVITDKGQDWIDKYEGVGYGIE